MLGHEKRYVGRLRVALMHGGHLLKTYSKTQANIALSSAEAEYYSMVKGTSVSLGVKAMMSDLGVNLKVRLNTDASAAKGISARRGLGKLRHLETSQLWLQDKVHKGEVIVKKIKGLLNPSDILTKPPTIKMLEELIKACSIEFQSGRHELMPNKAD